MAQPGSRTFFPGDPFCGHEWKVEQKTPSARTQNFDPTGSSRFFPSRTPQRTPQQTPRQQPPHQQSPRASPEAFHDGAPYELQNRAESSTVKIKEDPFLTHFAKAQDKKRVKVSVFHAKDLKYDGGKCESYVTVQVPGVSKSMLNTPIDYQHEGNPVWNFLNKSIWGWTPPKPLQFEVKNKSSKHGDALATMFGLAEDKVLGGTTLMYSSFWPKGFKGELDLYDEYGDYAGKLWVEVQTFGGPKPRRWLCNCCGDCCENYGHLLCEAIRDIPNKVEEVIQHIRYLLGPEYPNRKPKEMYHMACIPLMLYVFTIWLLCFVRHIYVAAVFFIIAVIIIVLIIIFVHALCLRKDKHDLPRTTLSCLCLLALVLGIGAGNHCWNFAWQQWWWMRTGFVYGGNQATTPAVSRLDASVVSFANAPKYVSVDTTRAAGFRIGGDFYCAAPILDPNATRSEYTRVNFWAIGINCCDTFGSFTCDRVREGKSNTGVVMVNHGMPCSGCHSDFFRMAANKSAGLNKMISSPAALFVRYVKEVTVVSTEYWLRGFGILIWQVIEGIMIFAALGWLVNFKGLGKPYIEPVNEPTKPVPPQRTPGCGSCIKMEKPRRLC